MTAIHRQPTRATFIVSIWVQGESVWRGYIETSGRQRTYFASLDGLNKLLIAYGWQDAAQPIVSPKSS